MKITFLGSTEEVTGSRYLVETENTKILVDCGLFQGGHELSARNHNPFPVDPRTINAIVLTHAHIDHTGYIPAIIKQGFNGTVYCSNATYALCEILLTDSGRLQEEEARLRGEQPLYTAIDAEQSLRYFKPTDYETPIIIGSFTATLIQSGHILGACYVTVSDGKRLLSFSGDLGRKNQPIMKDPPPLTHTDYLVVESTYGNKLHEHTNPAAQLKNIIKKTIEKGGVLIIPAFAVDRTQMILYYLHQLKQKHEIPNMPIFVDSPMATRVTNAYCNFLDEHKLSQSACNEVFGIATYVQTVQESKNLMQLRHPAIIIAGSGMANGGKVQYHLKHFISDHRNTIAFVGFQAPGTLGRKLIDGAKEIYIHDVVCKVRAEVTIIGSFSAHADYEEVLTWLRNFKDSPKKVFITHGELEAAIALKSKIEEQLHWNVVIPQFLASYELD